MSTSQATTPSTTVPPQVLRYARGPISEDRQFEFLVGDWQVQATKFNPDGTTSVCYTATWSAWYLNHGRMLIDDFQALAPDGRPISSFVTLRSYCVDTGRWEMVGLAAHQPAAPVEWHGRWVDGEMQVFAAGVDPSGQNVQTKIRFSEIERERFVWTSESSFDGGARWVRTASLVASRVA